MKYSQLPLFQQYAEVNVLLSLKQNCRFRCSQDESGLPSINPFVAAAFFSSGHDQKKEREKKQNESVCHLISCFFVCTCVVHFSPPGDA